MAQTSSVVLPPGNRKTMVMLVNLGSPLAPTRAAVAAFLAEFLSDRRVVELPRLLWQLILRGAVIPLRASRVAHAYASIWDGDSPLRRISGAQRELLQAALCHDLGEDAPRVSLAMCYQGPAIGDTVRAALRDGLEQLVVLPLYPQYSATTTGAVFDQIAACLQRERRIPGLRFVSDYHDHPAYIEALATRVRELRQQQGARHLLMSFHGIPVANVEKGDPYASQCERTAQLLAQSLGLAEDEWSMSYQSRFGRARWLEPYTDDVLARLAKSGVPSVDVICPAFSADCLETLEEIGVASREVFMDAGGAQFRVVPCLNDSPAHIRMMREIVAKDH